MKHDIERLKREIKTIKEEIEKNLLIIRIIENVEKYYELLIAVKSKYPNETRHQTAMRYITDRESMITKSRAFEPEAA